MSDTPRSIALSFSIAVASIALLYYFFYWIVADWITVFLMPITSAIVWCLIGMSIATSAFALKHFKSRGPVAAIPLVINILTILAILYLPLTYFWLHSNFFLYRGQRESVVKAVHDGRLVSNVPHNSSLILLPGSYSNISLGGNEIVVEEHSDKKYILFYTFRGILDNYAGFLHIESGSDPAAFSDLSEVHSTEIVHFADNWYYVSHR